MPLLARDLVCGPLALFESVSTIAYRFDIVGCEIMSQVAAVEADRCANRVSDSFGFSVRQESNPARDAGNRDTWLGPMAATRWAAMIELHLSIVCRLCRGHQRIQRIQRI